MIEQTDVGRTRVPEETQLAVVFEVEGNRTRVLLDATGLAAKAEQWERDPESDRCRFALPRDLKRSARSIEPVALTTLLGPVVPAAIEVGVSAITPSLAPDTYLFLKLLDAEEREKGVYRFHPSTTQSHTIPIVDGAIGLRIVLQLRGEGEWRPPTLRISIPPQHVILAPRQPPTATARVVVAPLNRPAEDMIPDNVDDRDAEWLSLVDPAERFSFALELAAAEGADIANTAAALANYQQVLVKRLETIMAIADETANPAGLSLALAPAEMDRANGHLAEARRLTARVADTLRRAIRLPTVDGELRVPPEPRPSRIRSTEEWRAGVVAKAMEAFARGGLSGGLTAAWDPAQPSDRAVLAEDLAERIGTTDTAAGLAAYQIAYGVNPVPRRARRIASRLFKAGHLTAARAMMARAPNAKATPFIGELRLATSLATNGIRVPNRRKRVHAAEQELAYVAASSQPFSVVGYATRTQDLLTALTEEGSTLTCYTRPGYPWDRVAAGDSSAELPTRSEVGSVEYVHSRIDGIEHEPEQFIERMADALVEQFSRRPPRVVQAASNSRNALPALLASRQLGIPFIYEVRGLWELTAASRIEGWEQTERFELDRKLEVLVAGQADHVLAITDAVADELASGGVKRGRIGLLPNAVDPDVFKPIERDEALARTFGIADDDLVLVYAGSVLAYEGLDDVVAAIALLRARSVPARLIVVGDGAFRPTLEALVDSTGMRPFVTLTGRVRPDQVNGYISLADVVPIVRKPFRVCEVVSPLKPFEAMAMEKTVVVSSVRALREIVVDGERGRVCQPADPADLARVLEELHRDRESCRALGKAARAWVCGNRTWRGHARDLRELYARL